MYSELTHILKEVFIKENLIDCKLSFQSKGFSCYSYEDKEVILDLEALDKQHKEFLGKDVLSCSFEDYAIITLLHEIGHYKDDYLPQSKIDKSELRFQMGDCDTLEEYTPVLDKYMKIQMDVEQTAWDYVLDKKLKGLHDEAIKIANHCLKLYEDSRTDLERLFCPM